MSLIPFLFPFCWWFWESHKLRLWGVLGECSATGCTPPLCSASVWRGSCRGAGALRRAAASRPCSRPREQPFRWAGRSGELGDAPSPACPPPGAKGTVKPGTENPGLRLVPLELQVSVWPLAHDPASLPCGGCSTRCHRDRVKTSRAGRRWQEGSQAPLAPPLHQGGHQHTRRQVTCPHAHCGKGQHQGLLPTPPPRTLPELL